MESTPRGLRIVNGLAQAVSRAGVALSALILTGMIIGTLCDVFLRFVFDKPIAGVIEFNGVYLPAFTFLALAMTQRLKGHINVTFGLQSLSPKARKAVELLGFLLALLFVATVGWEASLGALHSYHIGEYYWGVVGVTILIWPSKVAVAVGLWMLCLEYGAEILSVLAQLAGRIPIQVSASDARSHI
jgi:TRAP-type mannitol/chloroaromatic compound transport system permease small subunit